MERLDRRIGQAGAALATLDELANKQDRTAVERDGAVLRLIYFYEAVWQVCQKLLAMYREDVGQQIEEHLAEHAALLHRRLDATRDEGACRRMKPLGRIAIGAAALTLAAAMLAASARAEDLACVSTTFRILGANDKVCVSVFDDPKVPGVACDISQARTGGFKGSLGLAEDPSRFSLACRQVGPISVDLAKLPKREAVYSERTSIFFKKTHVYRIVDKKRNTLIYLAISDKIVNGSPQNAVSSVPVMAWSR
ncbi:MAG TPA: CreA family protein [Stellaceae bacterium]|nr:CreA family protein [Stellaceae bacterium]